MPDLKLWSLVTIAPWHWYKNRENRIRTEDPRINPQQYIHQISKEAIHPQIHKFLISEKMAF